MAWLGELISGGQAANSISSKELTVESHLEVIAVWLSHELTDVIAAKIPGANQLREKLLSDRNIIVAKLRTLKLAIRQYEVGYESIVSKASSQGSLKQQVTFVPGSHPGARLVMQNQIHIIDALEQNLVRNVSLMTRLIRENATKNKKSEYLTHVAVLEEAVKKFAKAFDVVEKAIDKLPVIKEEKSSAD